LAYQGNMIKANADTAMVVINQVQPIYVNFAVPEQELPAVKKYMALGKLVVAAVIGKDDEHPVEGVLTFVDNAVDKATGTIKLKGTFPNQDRRLWPGQFVNVILKLTMQPNAILAPTQAIQTGQQGPYVYVVKPDLTVEYRPVRVSRRMDGQVVVDQGLQAGEQVVTDGQLRLAPGFKVEIKHPEAGQGRTS
jgi:multidrug efflux system membrane fusion protein